MNGAEYKATYSGPLASISMSGTVLHRGVETLVSRGVGNALRSRYPADVKLVRVRGGAVAWEGPNFEAVVTPTEPVGQVAEVEIVEETVDVVPEEPAELESDEAVELESTEEEDSFSLDLSDEEDEEEEESIEAVVDRLAPSLSEEDASAVVELLVDSAVEVGDLTVFKGIGAATAKKLIEAVHG